jgi:SNF2 family DNA or RNA helicase
MTNIPFSKGDWVIDLNNPSQPGQYTGTHHPAGPHIMIQLSYPNGETCYRPLIYLEKMPDQGFKSIEDRITAGHFGNIRDLKRLITYEKLKGTLHAIIYSMEAAQIDFYPYQFKPVLKFINSPTERLIIADEVGLGKTIESAMIWIELQARKQAQRLLVICPKILSEKWRDELRSKFVLDARIVDFNDLKFEIQELKKVGPSYPFILIATYTGLRPSRTELSLLKEPPEAQPSGSPKTELLRQLFHWPLNYEPFNLVIFDEAHYMRNPGTTTFHLGECLAENAGAVLCVSATPVNNTNTDLHSLLRLTDKDFFESQGLFEELLEANRPAVQAINALSRTPVDIPLLSSAVHGMRHSKFIKDSPMFKLFSEKVSKLDTENKAEIARCLDIAEKLNLLSSYINRTRRVQVKENRPLRIPVVLAVSYKPEEMLLYKAIIQIIRNKCSLNNRPFHIFQVMGLQLRAASCLPVLAEEIKRGRYGDTEDLLGEALGEEVIDDILEEGIFESIEEVDLENLLDFNFEKNDTKYAAFRKYIIDSVPDEKVVVFAYYRPTLAYLRRRLEEDGVTATTIHGGIPVENRWIEIERFRDPRGPRLLLSSEVGSEGIDLQFCRIVVNYDMPWNPMRVEQRIGRIDRVGQKAKRLSIVNLKVKGTIEELVYDRLHSKLLLFANSLGDLEAVIGKEVQNLSVQLLSKDLTAEEEEFLIEQSERVIEERLIQIQTLEESGDTLIALSDYVQKRIEEDKEKGRYILPEELENYLSDFFEREFKGCEINFDTPYDGCLKVHLTAEAQSSLSDFIKDDKTLQARPLRQREFAITFKNDVIQRLTANQRRGIHYVNHISPLIRWMTKINRERVHNFYNVSAIKLTHPDLPAGDYCYRIERWKFKGLSVKESLAYGIMSIEDNKSFTDDRSEEIMQYLIHNGNDWDYVDCNKNSLLETHRNLEQSLAKRFSEAVTEFEMENTTTYQIKVQRVKGFFNRRIEQHKQRIQTLTDSGRDPRMLILAEGLLRTAENNLKQRLTELQERIRTDMEHSEVAAGIFRVITQ